MQQRAKGRQGGKGKKGHGKAGKQAQCDMGKGKAASAAQPGSGATPFRFPRGPKGSQPFGYAMSPFVGKGKRWEQARGAFQEFPGGMPYYQEPLVAPRPHFKGGKWSPGKGGTGPKG